MTDHKVLLLIAGLGKGGAETMLYQLIKYKVSNHITYTVASLGQSQYFEKKIRDLGVKVVVFDIQKHPIRTISCLWRMIKTTDILCCWMYHCNFLGFLIGKFANHGKIVWCIRHSNIDPRLNKRMTLIINKICAKWSNMVSLIIYNGIQAKIVHEQIGYSVVKACIRDNGCDCDLYKPNQNSKNVLRGQLNSRDKKIVLSVTKDTPIKDIPTFIKAFGVVHENYKDTVAVLCGRGVTEDNQNLMEQLKEENLELNQDVYFLGIRDDIPFLMAACDLYVLHSAGEAFPNVLLQAMSCGCACIATDVGDTKRILDDDECIVNSQDAKGLADKIQELLLDDDLREQKGKQNRARVKRTFDIRKIVNEYEECFRWL